jgi:hypothetical protein
VCELPNPPVFDSSFPRMIMTPASRSAFCFLPSVMQTIGLLSCILTHGRLQGSCSSILESMFCEGESTFSVDRVVRHLMPTADTHSRNFFALILLVAASIMATSPPVVSAGNNAPEPERLRSETIDAFNHYVQLTEARNDAELQRGSNLLQIDGLEDGPRRQAYEELKQGEVWIQRLQARDNGATIHCPDGMIHHWVGAIFIPGVKVGDVLAILQDYDRQSIYYAPDVERSKIESREGDHFRVFLRFRRHKVITVVLNTEHDVHYFPDSATRAHSRSSAVRIAEVENPGKSDEREKPAGDDGGFLWRMETWWRMIERDDGVYVQSEVVSLTRDIPTGLGWLVGPFVNSVPKESLTFTLQATRKAVRDRSRR